MNQLFQHINIIEFRSGGIIPPTFFFLDIKRPYIFVVVSFFAFIIDVEIVVFLLYHWATFLKSYFVKYNTQAQKYSGYKKRNTYIHTYNLMRPARMRIVRLNPYVPCETKIER